MILINIGFAGCGKTTFTKGFSNIARENGKSVYTINLDPASEYTDYYDYDIIPTYDTQSVMRKHKLGPNGAITACLNMFSTKIDTFTQKLLSVKDVDYILVDVPGQIEVFAWSAGGKIILQSFKKIGIPIRLNFIVDSIMCINNYKTFVSNMLFACQVLLVHKLPMVCVFNKTDNDNIQHEIEKMLNHTTTIEEEELYDNLLQDMQYTFKALFETVPYHFTCSKSDNKLNASLDYFKIKSQE